MSKKIEAHEYQLLKIFSADFDYHIPPYQRPYSWTKDDATTLFDDLLDFYRNEKEDNYFLGSIVLIKEEDKPAADVIDGQQRLTTLSILISCIASRVDQDYKKELQEYLIEPGKRSAGLSPKPRLTLRERDNSFFQKYIQKIELDKLVNQDLVKINEPQKHIVENARVFLKRIDETFGTNQTALEEFSYFLLQRCYLVVVATSSEDSAFRIFSVMNNRGLPLLATDIIKSEIIGQIEPCEQEKYTNIWEELEEELGRDDFNSLFAHIRMIFVKKKANQNLLDEFRTSVLPEFQNKPESFIEDILKLYAKSYFEIKNSKYESTSNASEINETLKWLNKIDNSDWMPPAILYFAGDRFSSEEKMQFIKNLERLAAYMHISSKDVNFRINRYAEIISQIQADLELSSLELTESEKENFRDRLNGDIYLMPPKRRNYVILRLDSFVSDGAAEYSPRKLTIEHVLPQSINKNSQWQKLWFDGLSDEEQQTLHDEWVHKIANLVPLTRRKNAEAQNFDFDTKKDRYFKGNKQTSSYALTTQVLNTSIWDLEVVKQRQKELLDIFISEWDLASDIENEQ
ncbi:DUF262 domain-containing protein [Ligilactobacillus apodemi]|uniref:DUF262 domain-containing protein n=1 Tax=Ligilactobacillus apodemi TaxID=307126 RepID=UPI00214B30F4|nr:DUF262 domain-containing HNH endonuclease family protein [Ligilactobacillus apodemi]MCR1900515.1 DUF262 domain-containing HNH endonuclease family protein [Ligilactobacillus apodemi]